MDFRLRFSAMIFPMPCLTYESEQKRAAREEKNSKAYKGSKSKVSVLHSHVFSAFDASSGSFKYEIALNQICLFPPFLL